MADTWILNARGCTARDVLSDGTIYHSLVGIKNGSTLDLEVRRIFVETSWDDGVAATTAALPFYRITSVSGGTPLTVASHDPSNAALPSQVKIVEHADQITVTDYLTGPGIMRGQYAAPAGTVTTPSIFMSRQGMFSGPFASWPGKSGSVQGIVLPEGSGVTVRQQTSFSARIFDMFVTIKNQSSGATYTVLVRDTPTATFDDVLTVFNGSGSGVTLEVSMVFITDVGGPDLTSNNSFSEIITFPTPGVRLMRCMDFVDGETVTPVAFDPGNTALPSTVVCTRNSRVVLDSASDTALRYTMNNFERNLVGGQSGGLNTVFFGAQTEQLLRGSILNPVEQWEVSSTNWPKRMTGSMRVLWRTKGAQPGIVLKHGECLSLTRWFRRTSIQGVFAANYTTNELTDDWPQALENYNITVEFTVAPATGDTTLAYGPYGLTETFMS